jgi:sporadic carbohydrate cluster protein (TIGR04323 family)
MGLSGGKGYRGYVSIRESGGIAVPSQTQNIMLRDYASRKGLLLKLPAVEHIYPGCYMVLYSVLDTLPQLNGIVMCSMFMLPQRAERRREIYQKLFKQGASLHLVMESRVVKNHADEEQLEELFSIIQALPTCPKNIPEELLPSLPCNVSFSK